MFNIKIHIIKYTCYNNNVINNMNKKGFTLIELLLVIALISITSTTASIGIKKIIDIKNNKEYKEYENQLKSAAGIIIELTKYEKVPLTIDKQTSKECKKDNKCLISSDILINEGLIDEDLQNPLTKNKLKDEKNNIIITWIDGEKKIELE